MNLQQLKCFVTVAEAGSFTRAAEILRLAQPGVSAHVNKLEKTLGQPLFHRSHHSVALTRAGRVALPYARAALSEAENVKYSVDNLFGLTSGQVRIGAVISCVSLDLAGLLASLHEAYPNIEISLSEGITKHLVSALSEEKIDFAFIGDTVATTGLNRFQINIDPLVAVSQKDVILHDLDSIPLIDLMKHRLIVPPEGTAMRDQFAAACLASGLTPKIAFEVADLRLAVSLATKGLGIAIVPKTIAQTQADLVNIAPIASPALDIRLSLAWPSSIPLTPAARALLNFIRGSFTTTQ